MTTPTTQPEAVDLNRLVLHLYPGQSVAQCPHCKGVLSKNTPVKKGDEPEEIRSRNATVVGMRMAIDPRPKCPHCFGRFELVIHLHDGARLTDPPAGTEPQGSGSDSGG